jgi:hypothetical protein
MSKQLSDQANKLWTLITEPSTAKTYREALEVSWKILRETGNFLWLVLCLALVGIDWFWENSIAAGRKTRAWVNNLTAEKPSPEQLLTPETGKKLLDSGKSTLDSVVAAARKQLGLSEKPPEPVAPPSPPAAASSAPSVVAPSPVVVSAESVASAESKPPAAIASTEE